MKCIICMSSDLEQKSIDEEFKLGNDIVFVSINTVVCQSCGERYYNRNTMRKIEEIKSSLIKKEIKLEEIGKVLRAVAV